MLNSLTQDDGLSRETIWRNNQIPSCVLRFIHAPCRVIARFSTRVHETTLPRLLLKRRRVRRQVLDRATLIGSQCYRNEPLWFHGTIRVECIFRLIGTLRLRITQTFILSSQAREFDILTPVDNHRPAAPAQEFGLTHLHLTDINFLTWNRRYTLRAIPKRRKQDVENRECAHVNHHLDGYPKFESSLHCCFCRLFHGLGILQYSLFSVRYS
jgi:hypothetical protein